MLFLSKGTMKTVFFNKDKDIRLFMGFIMHLAVLLNVGPTPRRSLIQLAKLILPARNNLRMVDQS